MALFAIREAIPLCLARRGVNVQLPRLPQPATTSPGFLVLKYQTQAVDHKLRFRYLAGVDPTDATVIGPKALLMANFLATVMLSSSNVSGWISQNHDGVELITGIFSPAIVGGINPAGLTPSESFTYDIIGRGAPGGGLAQGNTRVMWFPGFLPLNELAKDFVTTPGDHWDLWVTALNADAVVGADQYGSKANYLRKVDCQVNAHFQKRYGI